MVSLQKPPAFFMRQIQCLAQPKRTVVYSTTMLTLEALNRRTRGPFSAVLGSRLAVDKAGTGGNHSDMNLELSLIHI